MTGLLARLRRPSALLVALIGTLCLLAGAAIASLDPGSLVRNLREASFDRLLAAVPRSETAHAVMVVDIGRDALASVGPWPWPRAQLAALVNKVADAKPQTLAIDILLAARDPEPGDADLALALERVPTILAVVLDPEPTSADTIQNTVAVTGDVAVPDLLITPGALLPDPRLLPLARGAGVISLPAPEGEPVRAVPLLAGGAGALFAGLAVEALRVAQGGAALIASSPPQVLRVGELTLPLPPDGLMRLHFASAAERAARTIPAQGLLDGTADPASLAGKIVVLGASAPEAGGLRLTAVDALMPSLDIQAEAIAQMLSGHIPWRADFMSRVEILAGLVLGGLGILAVVMLPPGRAALAAAGPCSVMGGIRLRLERRASVADRSHHANPAAAHRHAGRRSGAIRAHLSPAPRHRAPLRPACAARSRAAHRRQSGRIASGRRDARHHRALHRHRRLHRADRAGRRAKRSSHCSIAMSISSPASSSRMAAWSTRSSAMRCMAFSMPRSIWPTMPKRRSPCAKAIIRATETLRRAPGVAPLELGRTRIGIETGRAVLGDVGRGAKRDYTAYGRPLNLASRLQSANKSFGSSIALGPGTVAALAGRDQA